MTPWEVGIAMSKRALPDAERVDIRNGYFNLVLLGWPTEHITIPMCVEAAQGPFDTWEDRQNAYGLRGAKGSANAAGQKDAPHNALRYESERINRSFPAMEGAEQILRVCFDAQQHRVLDDCLPEGGALKRSESHLRA
jgi:hypothetical protein